jgi:thioredoxin 1
MEEPTPEEVKSWSGGVVLEFGASWCPICQAARPAIDRAIAAVPGARHVWIEDGKGKRLGRSFGVTLWPTLVVLRDGAEVARAVRPHGDAELRALFAHAG